MERLIDRVARELKLDRAEVRRRNLIPAEKMPYNKPLKARSGAAMEYDSGDYPACQAEVLAAAGWDDFPKRQAEARAHGRYIGIGLAHGIKGTGRGPFESGAGARLEHRQASRCSPARPRWGQGLGTAMAQIARGELGVRAEDIKVVAGDTGGVSLGLGGFASRQTVTAGSSVHACRARGGRQGEEAREPRAGSRRARSRAGRRRGARGRRAAARRQARASSRASCKGAPGYGFPPGVDPGLEANVNGAPTRWPTPTPAMSPRSRSTSRPARCKSCAMWRCRIPAC